MNHGTCNRARSSFSADARLSGASVAQAHPCRRLGWRRTIHTRRDSSAVQAATTTFPKPLFRVDLTGHCAEGGGNRGANADRAQLVRGDPEVVGRRGKRPAEVPHGAGEWGRSRPVSQLIENLPAKPFSCSTTASLAGRGDDRDERMTLLFRSWPSLGDIELRELRRLNDERQRVGEARRDSSRAPRTPGVLTGRRPARVGL